MNADDSLWVPFQHEGTLFGSIGKTQLNELRIKWPNGEVTNVETVLAALDSEVESLSYETARLVSLRDALIPKLLNGQIQVSDTHLLGDVAV
jgi:type I restriction enzyme S subunit